MVRAFLIKLKTSSLFNLLKDNYYILLINICLLLLLINTKSIIILLLIIGYLIYLLKISPKLALFTIIILVIILINYILKRIIFNNNLIDNYDGFVKVIKIIKKDTNYQIIFKTKHNYLITYLDNEPVIGSTYYLKCAVIKASKAHYPGGFNYYEYLKNKNIIGITSNEQLTYIKKGYSIYQLNYYINKYYDNYFHTESKGIIKALTIGIKEDIDDNLLTKISSIGISHLFVISGLHVQIICNLLNNLLNKLHIKIKYQNKIIILIILIYYLISGLLISVLRVILNKILSIINKKYQFNLSNIDIISLNIIIVLVFNPLYLYQYSFLLSYIIAFSITVCSKYLIDQKTLKSKIINNIKISFISTLVTLPIITNINPSINYLSIIYNLLFIPFVTSIMLPFAMLTTIIYPLEYIFNYIYKVFKLLTTIFSNISILTIDYPATNIEFILIYYIVTVYLLYNILNKNKIIIPIILFLIIQTLWTNMIIFNNKAKVYFLDLPKGESTLIIEKHNQLNILIDTGESNYNDIIIFLKKLGIKRLDLVIITHPDSDHFGMLKEISNEFRIKKIIKSKYDNKTRNYIKKNIPIISVNPKDKIKYKNISIEFISPTKDYNDTNNNSLVFKLNFYQKIILFTGDIEEPVEKNLPYIGKVNILKVPHHGSNTSTSNSLLSKVDFDLAICMNGYKNSFSFPTLTIKKKLKNKLYITSDKGTYILKQ